MKKRVMLVLSLVMVASMLLAACQPATVTVEVSKEVTKEVPQTQVVQQTVVVEKTVEVVKEITPTPEPVTRKGAWVDKMVFTSIDSADQAVSQLQAGDLDVYAYTVADPKLFATVKGDSNLAYNQSVGSYDELTFNPAGPVFEKTKELNPFAVPAIREAMNWLVDRNYIVQEIFGGLAVPKFMALNSAFADYARYVDVARKIEANYAYNPDKAKEVVTAEMQKLGATLVDGKWQFDNKPVKIIVIIRTEDARKQIGDYFSNQLETLGFTVDRQYKTRSEASPIWNRSNPNDGLWHVYTGGWITTAISRDDGSNFAYFYTNLGSGSPLWQAYKPTEEYFTVAEKLWNNKFASMDERAQLFKQAMELSMKDSVRVWLMDQLSFTPLRSNVTVAYDLAGAVAGSSLYPYTIRIKDQVGGTVHIAQPGILVDPWNPVAGSNWIYDSMPRAAINDAGTLADPYTGLSWPQRIEKADIVVKEGLPVAKTLDWVTLTTAPSIEVPKDAWADWNAKDQKFITVGEKYTSTVTANTKRTVTYPKDLWTTVKWHDGSAISVGDFVMGMILTFDRAKKDSAIFDESAVPAFDSFMSVFKGVKIVSTDPLVIETYSDAYGLDAENMATDWWPQYGFGVAPWQEIAIGARAEAAKKLTFSADKADVLKKENEKIEWMSYVAGPSLDILKTELISSTAESYVPYAPTMGTFVTKDEATTRWANYGKFFRLQGHFWVGAGPFYLDKAFPVEGSLTLSRFEGYPDLANKWDRFGTPMIAAAEVDGPGQVAAGDEPKFDVLVTFGGKPYPNADISEVKYLLFNAKGELVDTGAATAVEDGKFQVALSKDVTGKLVSGSNKIEVAVTSKVVSIPTFASFQFVTP